MKFRILRRLTPFLLSLAALASPGKGAPPGVVGSTSLVLEAAEPRFTPLEGQEMLVPSIEGFGASARPGEPMLPLKIVRVAIPEGSVPELRVTSVLRHEVGRLRLAPVPRAHVQKRTGRAEDERRDAVYSEDARVFGRDADFPGEAVRLGSIGYLREQRFVEVIQAPLQYNPVTRQVRYYPEVRAEIVFKEGPGTLSAEPLRRFRPDPYFEETYKRALVNYEQGKLFRATTRSGDVAVQSLATPAQDLLAAAAAPGAPRYKISASSEGIYRLSYSDLQSSAPDLLALYPDPGTWVLSAEGVEVPISIRSSSGGPGEADGHFDPGDTLDFYGRPKGGPPTSVNFLQAGFPTVYEANDFTDTQVYWLTAGGTAGSHLRITETSGAPLAGYTAATDFEQAGVWDENNIYIPLDAADPFFSMPSLIAGGAQAQRDLTLPLPGLATTTLAPLVTLRVRGGTSVAGVPFDHDTRFWLNGDLGGARYFLWDGETIFSTNFPISPSILTNPTTIHVAAQVQAGVSVDQQYLDSITIKYRRSFDSVADALPFNYPNQDVRFNVRGFSGPPPAVYEVTRSLSGSAEASPVRITNASVSGAPPVTCTFELPRDASPGAPATRAFIVVGPQGFLHPLSIQTAPAPVLKDPTNSADILVIGTPETIDASPTGSLQALLDYRLQHQELTSRVVYMSQIYDEFSYGLRDANAIRSFLAYAFDNWKGTSGVEPPPSFVLLVGDATPDYKHTLTAMPGWVDQVPTPMMFLSNAILGYYSSDNWLAAFRGGDPLPDIHLGRISTRTAIDSAAVFDKIRQYEASPPPGLWKGRALLLASDGNDDPETAEFEGVDNQIASRFFSTAPYSTPSPPLYFAEPPYNGTDAAGFKRDFTTALSGGAAIVTYVGHGDFNTWGARFPLFTTQDASRLTNGGPLPFMVTVNCLTGGFHFFLPEGSVGEGMTNNPVGGTIASLAPSGLSSVLVATPLLDSFFDPLFGNREERLVGVVADDLRAGLWAKGDLPDLQSYTLLGDPATLLATPAPPPPTSLVASAGNATVQLGWTAPAPPAAGYRVYRSTSAAGPYGAVACDPITGASCVDRTVANATTYYYYLVSFDTQGFEGRASNFNSDCDTGPDCVSARPLNPNPPSVPTGLTATDPGSGGRLNVAWLANPESDIKGYTLYYGIQSGQYPGKIAFGEAASSALLSGLTNGVRYYLALSATNTSGHESAPSGEVSAVPLLFEGIAPPREITDLVLSRSGSNLILTWSRPLVDIYGRSTTVVKYTVYRGTAPGFMPFLSTPLAVINDGSIITYTDAGAGAPGPTNFYYVVTATDLSGLVSGAGRELPNGIETLAVTRSAGMISLAWPAVTTDVSGLATIIDHYQIHASSLPFSRGSIGPSTLLVDNVRGLTVNLTLPSGKQYYSVIAVDNRGNLSPF